MDFRYKETCLIGETEIESEISRTSLPNPLLKKVVDLPRNEQTLKDVMSLKEKVVTKNLRYIILLGIGGSNLGAKAVYDALTGQFEILEPTRFPKIIFLDTLSSKFSEKLFFLLSGCAEEEVLINVVSNSGTTFETLENFNLLIKTFPDFSNRIVVTTQETTPLYIRALENKWGVLTIPMGVTGRFSFFTSVGLFPLAAAEIDVVSLLEGAMELNADTNAALVSATVIYINYVQNKIIHNNMFFNPELESMGKWCRQLTAESLGKNGKGITPTVSIGTTDLHSMFQLYAGGPKDKFTTFVYGRSGKQDVIQNNLEIIYDAVKNTYRELKLPFSEIKLLDLSEKSLGSFMQFKTLETIYTAILMDVNAFDEPEVELYKDKVRALLNS